MRKLFLLAFLASAIVCMVHGTGIRNGVYTLSVHLGGTEKVMDVAGGGRGDESNIQIYSRSRVRAQKFRIEKQPDGAYLITNVRSGKVLDILNGDLTDGNNIQQYSWVHEPDQQWIFEKKGNGYRIHTYAAAVWDEPDKVLDVAGAKAANGTNVQIYHPTASPGQVWYLSQDFSDCRAQFSLAGRTFLYTGSEICPEIRVKANGNVLKKGTDYEVAYRKNVDCGTAEAVVNGKGAYEGTRILTYGIVRPVSSAEPGKTYRIVSKKDASFVLDAKAGGMVRGTRIWLYRNNGTGAQHFQAEPDEDGTCRLVNVRSGLVLDVKGNSPGNGAPLQLYGSNGTAAQQWALHFHEEDGSFSILNSTSGKAVDIPGGNAKSGSMLQMYTDNGTDAQRFFLEEVQP